MDILSELRSKGISVAEVSRAIGRSHSHVWRALHGQRDLAPMEDAIRNFIVGWQCPMPQSPESDASYTERTQE